MINRTGAKIYLVQHSVRGSVLARNRDRVFVAVTCFDVSVRKQFGCRNRENSGAGADIKKATAGIMLLNRVETESRGLVSAGAESHAGFDSYDQTIRLFVDLSPRGRNDETSNLNRLPTLFPFFQPITLWDCAHVHVAHGRCRQVVNARSEERRVGKEC